MPGACRRHIYGEVGEGREHAGVYKLGMYKQKMEQMIGVTVSMQAAKVGKLGESREHAGAYKVEVDKQTKYLTRDRRCPHRE